MTHETNVRLDHVISMLEHLSELLGKVLHVLEGISADGFGLREKNQVEE